MRLRLRENILPLRCVLTVLPDRFIEETVTMTATERSDNLFRPVLPASTLVILKGMISRRPC